MTHISGEVRPYSPSRASPRNIDELRMFVQSELDKISQALATAPRILGAGFDTSAGETGILIWVNATGTPHLERVEVGAADSAGVGYRALRVPN